MVSDVNLAGDSVNRRRRQTRAESGIAAVADRFPCLKSQELNSEFTQSNIAELSVYCSPPDKGLCLSGYR
jgi:hypothetical protein